MSNLAVAANPPVHTGPAPATAGVSSPTIAPADAAGGRDQVFTHLAVSSHGPTGAVCYYCGKALTALNARSDCPDRARKERDERIQAEAPAMVEALRAIAEQRDHFAEHGRYALGHFRPADDQAFDDWAADLASAILARIDGRA